MNPNDELRAKILEYFYQRNSNATSRYGKKGSAVKISDARKDLKILHGLKQTEVVSNLTYLIDRSWIKTIDIEKTVRVKGGTIPSSVTWYEITANGIDKIEGGSEFQPKDRYPGINISASGQNIITLGDGNIINAKYEALHKELSSLKEKITEADCIDDEEKLSVAVDIESIKDQLAKPHLDKTIIGHLWSGIEKVVTGAGLIDVILKAQPLINSLIC